MSTRRGQGSRPERSLAGTYLRQAVEHLEEGGNPAFLYEPIDRETESLNAFQEAVALSRALTRRLDTLRSSVLFAALAAEAYVNVVLASLITGKDLDAVDRLSTVNKYVVGTRLALGQSLFERDKEPVTSIAKLFALRHKLVHPKPGYAPPMPTEMYRHEEDEFTPENAARYICSVAIAAALLISTADPESGIDYPAHVIALEPEILIDFAAGMDALPGRREPATIPSLLGKRFKDGEATDSG